MKYLKNEFNKNPNDVSEKTRKNYIIIIIIICLIIISSICFSMYYFDEIILNKTKYATTSNCVIPYTTSNCKYARNETVKQIQKMLNKLEFYNESYGYDGNFGPKTVTAVKAFQKSQGTTQDGSVGPDTLEKLAKATNTQYFKIKYDKNGGTGSLKSNTQIILYSVPTKINNVKLNKSNSTHVGYVASTTLGGIKIRYGCFGNNCSSNYRIYTEAQIKANKNKFNDYVYSIGEEFSNSIWMTGHQITFTAKYCGRNETYDKTTNACKPSPTPPQSNPSQSNPSQSNSYNITAELTGYGVDCCGGHGMVACFNYMPNKKLFSSSDYTYNDSQYGNVRVVAMKLSSHKSDCGTIIEIENYTDADSTKKAVKAIVLDTGVGSGIIDLLVKNEKYARDYIGRQNIKYKVLRKGFAK